MMDQRIPTLLIILYVYIGSGYTQTDCGSERFRCQNGECIANDILCDGKADCTDSSDESEYECKKPEILCPAFAFRCNYGACINRDSICNGIQDCVDSSDEDSKLCGWSSLRPARTSIRTIRSSPVRRSVILNINNCTAPPQPDNGRWKLHPALCSDEQDCNVPEGTEVGLGAHLIYSCNSGYKIKGATDVICNFQKKWQPAIPICTAIRCEGFETSTTIAECKYKDQWISCQSPVPPKTSAELSCENLYIPANDLNLLSPQRNSVTCNENGQWEPEPIRCIIECGLLSVDVKPLTVGRFQANIAEFPWHATMYHDNLERKKFICGASIIHENLLLTAAHCVYDESTKQLYEPSKIYILTGNTLRNYDDASHNPKFVQRNQVKRIYIDSGYLGVDGNFLHDIAILELVTPFVISATLVPACIDTSNDTDKNVLEPDTLGKTAGFGKTATESNAVLQALTLPIIDLNRCRFRSQNPETQRYFTYDKFCAGYTNDSPICDIEGGSGLIFKTDDMWYLRGIVSVSLGMKGKDGSKHCDNKLYILYTDISKYISWIQTVITAIEYNRTSILCLESSKTRCS